MKKSKAIAQINPVFLNGIAHRGLHNKEFTENGLKAFENAINHGVAFEFDIHLTTDGELIVCHDENLKRTTGKEGIIEHMTSKEIRDNYRLLDGGVVPTLQEVFDLNQERVPMVIELKVFKEYNTNGLSTITIEKVTTQLTKEIFKNGFDLSGITFNAQDTEDFSLTSNGNLTIKTDKPNPEISFTVAQNYNNLPIPTEINNFTLNLNTSKIFSGISAKIKYDLNQSATDITGSILSKFDPAISTKYINSNLNSVMIKKGDSSAALCYTKIDSSSYYVFNGWMLNNTIVTNNSGTFNKNVSGYISDYKWIYVGTSTITFKASWSKVNTYSNYKYITLSSELYNISTTGNYLLINDIDLSNSTWNPLSSFSGILDGNGKMISNLRISISMEGVMASQDDVRGGFICTNSGTIKNLTFSSISVYYNGVEPRNVYVGGIVGWNEGTISNCHIVGGSVEGNTGSDGFNDNFVSMTGGICGDNMYIISNCSVKDLDIIGVANCRKGVASIYVGGISGKNNSQVLDCSNYNSCITARGGGYNSSSCLVKNCAGGIVGNNSPNCTVTYIESSPNKLETPRTNSNGKTVDGFGNAAHGNIIGYQE